MPKEEIAVTPAQFFGTIRDMPVNEYISVNASAMNFDVIPSDTFYGTIFLSCKVFYLTLSHRSQEFAQMEDKTVIGHDKRFVFSNSFIDRRRHSKQYLIMIEFVVLSPEPEDSSAQYKPGFSSSTERTSVPSVCFFVDRL